MSKSFVVAIFFLPILISCTSGNKKPENRKLDQNSGSLKYALGFEIENFNDYRKLTVFDPWQKSKDISFEYFLVDRNKKIPKSIEGKQIIRTPVQKVICLSTTHIGFLDALDELNSIVALSGTANVSNSKIIQEIDNQRIFDVGYDQGLNYELILSLKPDLVFAYGVGSEISNHINKLRDLGVNVVLVGEYLEKSPLAKAEWLKFFGTFYNKGNEAEIFFDGIGSNYKAIANSVSNISNRPKVLTGLPYNEAWWMSGGDSYISKLIADAGADFLWKENRSHEAFIVSIEDVFMRASKADFWINCGAINNMAELVDTNPRFSGLLPVKNSAVFNNNLRISANGGNDYWESGVVHPDLILSDLVKIFHAEKMSDKPFYYYKKIE